MGSYWSGRRKNRLKTLLGWWRWERGAAAGTHLRSHVGQATSYHITAEVLFPSAPPVKPYLGRWYYHKVTAARCQNCNPTEGCCGLARSLAKGVVPEL